MQRIHIGIIGIIAGILTTISFIPQITRVFRTKQVRDVSLYMFIILTLGIVLWLVYGILLKELPIILANLVSFILCSFIIWAKVRYKE